ncbi:unnamed protein product [Vitrella brassicaformis CCMP3155]|uniref:SEC7 domain-containing protein n=4 Tax=Vitrella brassicaformis TaxID=1169539 RepID=A0A0G4EIW5_VITBC|nr:unnamed protein product [Vitrella brassicaformis CCMP3155]|eukprot:CEL96641.1 unnamed protein product [Vitrella brassicaformis CCMP3155]
MAREGGVTFAAEDQTVHLEDEGKEDAEAQHEGTSAALRASHIRPSLLEKTPRFLGGRVLRRIRKEDWGRPSRMRGNQRLQGSFRLLGRHLKTPCTEDWDKESTHTDVALMATDGGESNQNQNTLTPSRPPSPAMQAPQPLSIVIDETVHMEHQRPTMRSPRPTEHEGDTHPSPSRPSSPASASGQHLTYDSHPAPRSSRTNPSLLPVRSRSSDNNGSVRVEVDRSGFRSRSRTKQSPMDAPSQEGGQKQMELLEKQIQYREKLEKAVLIFNNTGVSACLDYMSEEGMIDQEDSLSVAHFLLTVEGLDKRKIGELLGKDNALSLAVLNGFVQLLDFHHLACDEALRYFLSRFFLPGESQMVYRVLERFSVRYARDNPEDGLSSDQVLTLAYALVILNTSLHSQQIKPTDRMKKADFVDMCTKGGVPVGTSRLEEMFDRVHVGPFKPSFSAGDKVYGRLARDPKVIRGHAMAKTTPVDVVLLKQGSQFVKYGRRGRPHVRQFWLADNEKRLYWGTPPPPHHLRRRPSHPAVLTSGSESGGSGGRASDRPSSALKPKRKRMPRYINLDQLTGMTMGPSSAVFRRQRVADESDARCFSLHADERTVDLFAPEEIWPPLVMWTNFFHQCLQENQDRRPLQKPIDVLKEEMALRRRMEEHRLAKWRDEVLPNFSQHWNCGAGLCSGFDRERLPGNEPKVVLHAARKFALDRSRRYETAATAALCELWCQGIPDTLRCKLWPLAIGNEQRVSEELFHHLRDKVAWLQSQNDLTSRACKRHIESFHREASRVMPRLLPLEAGFGQTADTSIEALSIDVSEQTEERRKQLIDQLAQSGRHADEGIPPESPQGRKKKAYRHSRSLDVSPRHMKRSNVSSLYDGSASSFELSLSENVTAVAMAEGGASRRQSPKKPPLPPPKRQQPQGGGEGEDRRLSDLLAFGSGTSLSGDSVVSVSGTIKALQPQTVGPHPSHPRPSDVGLGRSTSAFMLPPEGEKGPTVTEEMEGSNGNGVAAGGDSAGGEGEGGGENTADFTPLSADLTPLGVVDDLRVTRSYSALGVVPSLADAESTLTHGPTTIERALVDIIESYIVFRPEVGYVQGLASIAALLLYFMNPPKAFVCFVNLIHSHFFIDLIKVNRRGGKWRFDFFETVFKERLPLLAAHFDALDITPDTYLIQWYLTLFSTCLPLHVVCRVWDTFFLLGEAFSVQTALGILKYHEHALITVPFEGCIKLLHRPPDPLTFDQDRFFQCVDSMRIPTNRFGLWTAAQRLSELKVELLQVLL